MNAKLLRIPAKLSGETVARSDGKLDAQQFMAWYDEYFGRVYNYACYRCGDSVTADDLVALTFERVLLHLEDYDARRGSFGAWLFKIARNVINNHLRGEARRAHLPLEYAGDQADQTVSPEDRLIQGETQTEMLLALAQLSERERDLLSLKFAGRLTNRRIAEVTGISETNVGVILYRAVRRLRAVLAVEEVRNG
ncbi:MAG: sigma-70 family RNA polymerase sigma factor [Chloroflexota bacterium]